VQQGADLTACTIANKTPLQVAQSRNNTVIAEYLAQQERFQLLPVYDCLMRLGLYSVERHMILSCYSHESNRIGELDFQAIRAEFDSLNPVHEVSNN